MDNMQFYEAVINAGAILAGFCSTFLVFRIQRESNYYRQSALSYEQGKAKDIYIGLTHFTSSFLLIILAATVSMVFGLLYGTVMNEGANKGIIVTTSTYGPDAYAFAKGKPLVLIDGNNLLYLLEKHRHKAWIDIREAKKLLADK